MYGEHRFRRMAARRQIRPTGTVVEMRRVNQVNTHAVEMPEKQRDTSSEGIATRHDLCIGNAATNIWKRREQHAGIHAVRNLRGR